MDLKYRYSKLIFVLAFLILLLVILPFVILCFYSSPLTDDYTYVSILKELGLINSQKRWYLEWTGRYTSSFLISTNPLALNWELGESIIPLLIIVAFIFSLFYFIKNLSLLSGLTNLVIFVLIFALYLSNLHTVAEAFFWLAGAYTYTLATAIFLFLWGYIINLYRRDRSIGFRNYLSLVLLLFFLQGTNELIIFYNGYLAFLFFIFCYYSNRIKLPFAAIVLVFSCIFGLLSLLAPGNYGRHGSEGGEEINLIMSVYSAFALSTKKWLLIYTLDIPFILVILTIVVFVIKDDLLKFKNIGLQLHPFLLFCILYVGYVFTFLPGTLAQVGNYSRTLNFSYFTFILATVTSAVYTVMYYKNNLYERAGFSKKILILFLIITPSIIIFIPESNIAQAYRDLYSGEAACYKKQLVSRHKFLAETQFKGKVLVKPLRCKPESLNLEDVGTDVHNWKNGGYEAFYKIDTVLAEY